MSSGFRARIRYLHLSCHGDDQTLEFTFSKVDYGAFASIFDGKMNNRRLFVSGCSLGNMQFAKALFNKNGGMYSVTAPQKKVFFSQTAAFWPAFYYMMHAWDSTAMKKPRLQAVLERLTEIFEMPLAHYFKNSAKAGAVEELIFAKSDITQALDLSKTASPAGDNEPSI